LEVKPEMATPKKAATPKSEVETPEQEPTTEEASPVEAEAEEQRGEETPDPLAGLTTEQLREHPLFVEASADLTAAQKEAREKAYRDGQSAGAKQADEDARQWAAQQEAIKVFDDLEQKRVSQDPDDLQEYANAMGNPKAKEAYERGRSAKQGPGAEEIATNAVGAAMTEVYQSLKQHPLLKDMTEEEHTALREKWHDWAQAEKAQGRDPDPYTKLIGNLNELIAERGTAAGRIAEDAKQLKDAKEEGRRDAYDEMGLQYPGPEIEDGGTPPSQKLPTKKELDGMTQEQINELEREGKLDEILAGH